MTTYVIDASVAIKWFIPEEYSPLARSLLTDETVRLAPDFLLVEFAHVTARLVRGGELSADDARRAYARLVTMLSFDRASTLVPSAFEIAIKFDRSVYDSLYVALASLRGCPLVTADRRLYNALATSLGETMLWIEDVPTA